jgi:hypothetical protein
MSSGTPPKENGAAVSLPPVEADERSAGMADNGETGPQGSNGLPFHRYAGLFPMMSDDQIEELSKDIAENGQREPLVLFQGQILDGRNRAVAVAKRGLTWSTRDFDGTESEALNFVVSKNLHRRHLNESQRAMIAASMAKMKHGGDRKSDQAASLLLDRSPKISGATTQAQAAKMMGVSERSVIDARYVEEMAPEMAESVRAGKLSVSRAAKETRARRANRSARAPQAPSTTQKQTRSPRRPRTGAPDERVRGLLDAIRAVQDDEALDPQSLLLAGMGACSLIKNLMSRLPSTDCAHLVARMQKDLAAGIAAGPQPETPSPAPDSSSQLTPIGGSIDQR